MNWRLLILGTVILCPILIFENVEAVPTLKSKYTAQQLEQLFNNTSFRRSTAISVHAKKAGGGRKPVKIATDPPKTVDTISENSFDDSSTKILSPDTTNNSQIADQIDNSEDLSKSEEDIQDYCANGFFRKRGRCVPIRCFSGWNRNPTTWACEMPVRYYRSHFSGQTPRRRYVYRRTRYRSVHPGGRNSGPNGGVILT